MVLHTGFPLRLMLLRFGRHVSSDSAASSSNEVMLFDDRSRKTRCVRLVNTLKDAEMLLCDKSKYSRLCKPSRGRMSTKSFFDKSRRFNESLILQIFEMLRRPVVKYTQTRWRERSWWWWVRIGEDERGKVRRVYIGRSNRSNHHQFLNSIGNLKVNHVPLLDRLSFSTLLPNLPTTAATKSSVMLVIIVSVLLDWGADEGATMYSYISEWVLFGNYWGNCTSVCTEASLQYRKCR